MAKHKPAYQEDLVIQVTVRITGPEQPSKAKRAELVRCAKYLTVNSSHYGTFSISPVRCRAINSKAELPKKKEVV